MARKYGLNGSRGNMIIKEFLVESGVDISRFKNSYIKAASYFESEDSRFES